MRAEIDHMAMVRDVHVLYMTKHEADVFNEILTKMQYDHKSEDSLKFDISEMTLRGHCESKKIRNEQTMGSAGSFDHTFRVVVVPETLVVRDMKLYPFIRTEEVSERMGEEVHNLWMEERKKEKGWHAPEDCPEIDRQDLCMSCDNRVDGTTLGCMDLPGEAIRGKSVCPTHAHKSHCSNCHARMRPYNDLPDSEKELDRAYPAAFFRILDEMGLEIVKGGG